MTTLRVEVGRHVGTSIEDVVQGLRLAGCMHHLEIDPSAYQFFPIDEVRVALENDGFTVDLVPWPAPPPLPLWRRVRGWPGRAYRWGRRLFLGETVEEQFLADIFGATAGDRLHEASTRASPFLLKAGKVYSAEQRERDKAEFARWRKDGEP